MNNNDIINYFVQVIIYSHHIYLLHNYVIHYSFLDHQNQKIYEDYI